MKEEVGYSRYIKSLAMDLVVVLVACSYVLYQMVSLKQTDVNPLVLLAQGLMGIICGVVIKQSLGENGFSMGYNSDFWRDEERKYNDTCSLANNYMDKVDNFYQYEEIEKKRNYRRQKLQGVRLKYDMWFDENGDYIDREIWHKFWSIKARKYRKNKTPLPDNVSILDFRQMITLRKCVKVKIYPLNLFSHYAITLDQFTRKEATDNKQRVSSATKNTLSAVLIAILGVYFVPQLNNWNWASFISATMQVALWVLFGILQMYTNYNFVVQDRTSTLRQKKETIKRFVSGCEKGLFANSPYAKEAPKELTLN